MKKELEEKAYTLVELAEWFGITPGTLKNNRKRKLEELKAFAVFIDLGVRKGILIKEVIEPVYSKKGCESRRILVESVPALIDQLKDKETNKALTSYKQLAEIGIEKNKLSIKSSTGVRYTKEGVCKYYGDEKYSPCCKRIWAVKEGEHYRYLTQEEREFLQELTNKYYGAQDNEVRAAKNELKMLKKQGEISEGEYREELRKLLEKEEEAEINDDNFEALIWDFREKYGNNLVKILEVEDNKIIEWEREYVNRLLAQ